MALIEGTASSYGQVLSELSQLSQGWHSCPLQPLLPPPHPCRGPPSSPPLLALAGHRTTYSCQGWVSRLSMEQFFSCLGPTETDSYPIFAGKIKICVVETV